MKIYLPINKMITFMKKTHTQVNNSKINTKYNHANKSFNVNKLHQNKACISMRKARKQPCRVMAKAK